MNDKTIDLAELLIDPLAPATDASAFANGMPLYAAEIAEPDPSAEPDRAEPSPAAAVPAPTPTDDASQTADKRANAERNLRWLLKCRSTLPLALLAASVVMIRVPFQPTSRTAAKNRPASAAAPLPSSLPDTPSAEALAASSPANRQENAAVNSAPTPPQNLSTAADRPDQSETQAEPPRSASVDSSSLASDITDSSLSSQFTHPQTTNTESVQPLEKPEMADQADISATLPSTTGSAELTAENTVAAQTAMPAEAPTANGNPATTNTNSTEPVSAAVKSSTDQVAGSEIAVALDGEASEGEASGREGSNGWDLWNSLLGGGFETGHDHPQPRSSELTDGHSESQEVPDQKAIAQTAVAQNGSPLGSAKLPQVGQDAYPLMDGARRPVAVHIEPTDRPLDNDPHLTLVNPTATGGPVRCLVGTRVIELHPGDRLTLEGGPTWPIAFHRGGALPEHRAELSAGFYTFEVSREHGWRLTPIADVGGASAEAAGPQTSPSDPIKAEVEEGDGVTGQETAAPASVEESN